MSNERSQQLRENHGLRSSGDGELGPLQFTGLRSHHPLIGTLLIHRHRRVGNAAYSLSKNPKYLTQLLVLKKLASDNIPQTANQIHILITKTGVHQDR